MLSRIYTAALCGIDGFEVTVECSARKKLPGLEIIGLADTAVKEAKERIRAAAENSGIRFPGLEIILNLAPANRRKEGSAFDLAMLCGVLVCGGTLPAELDFSKMAFIGELSLSGEVRGIDGALVEGVEAHDGVSALVIDVLDGLRNALAQVATLVAVAQLAGLKGAGRSTRRHHCAAKAAVLEHDLDLDGGVAAGVQDLTALNVYDLKIVHDLYLHI